MGLARVKYATLKKMDRLQVSGLKKLNAYFYRKTEGKNRPVFLDTKETCNELLSLDENIETICEELNQILPNHHEIPKYYDVDHLQSYISGKVDRSTDIKNGWKVFMLYLMGDNVKSNQKQCPKTTELLLKIPHLYQAFFSILDPGKSILKHSGPYFGYIRYHLAIKVPALNPPELIIKDQSYCWKKGQSILFDDTWPHEVKNKSNEIRVVLIVDILRPMPLIPHLINKTVSWLFIRNFYGKKVHKNINKLKGI